MSALVERPRPSELGRLEPLSRLSPERVAEIVSLGRLLEIPRDGPTEDALGANASVRYLLSGELFLHFRRGGTEVLVGGHGRACRPLPEPADLAHLRAITGLRLFVLERDVLDLAMTWDQIAASADAAGSVLAKAVRTDPRIASGPFSIQRIRQSRFSGLPPAHIEVLLSRFERIRVSAGDRLIREGDAGDYYYLIESGRYRVERQVGGARIVVAELRVGDAFGEEALASGARRNATVRAATPGWLLRLSSSDFDSLLREPLLRRVDAERARDMVAAGAIWIDVRYPSEYLLDRLPGSVNLPLNELREMTSQLEPGREYIAYCESGRRSAAASYLLAERGHAVWMLDGGLWEWRRALRPNA